MRRSEAATRRRRLRLLAFAAGTGAVVLLGVLYRIAHAPAPVAATPAAVTDAASLPVPADPRAGADWGRLSPLQRQALRARYAAWQALPAEEKQRVRAAAAEFAALPAERREALRAQFAGLDRVYRDGWRLGPSIGGDYVALHPLVGFVPGPQRDALLALLRSLDAEQRGLLARIAQRTPPQERDALRATLLALPPDQREAWLRRNAAR